MRRGTGAGEWRASSRGLRPDGWSCAGGLVPGVVRGVPSARARNLPPSVSRARAPAATHPRVHFQRDRVGCGLAGYTDSQIAERQVLEEAAADAPQRVRAGARGLVLSRDGWHPGVVGIVASRVVERFHRPAVLVGISGGVGKGSGRSIEGFHLYDALALQPAPRAPAISRRRCARGSARRSPAARRTRLGSRWTWIARILDQCKRPSAGKLSKSRKPAASTGTMARGLSDRPGCRTCLNASPRFTFGRGDARSPGTFRRGCPSPQEMLLRPRCSAVVQQPVSGRISQR
jgi:hypothetical protein